MLNYFLGTFFSGLPLSSSLWCHGKNEYWRCFTSVVLVGKKDTHGNKTLASANQLSRHDQAAKQVFDGCWKVVVIDVNPRSSESYPNIPWKILHGNSWNLVSILFYIYSLWKDVFVDIWYASWFFVDWEKIEVEVEDLVLWAKTPGDRDVTPYFSPNIFNIWYGLSP